jgi:hypothetical protein
MQQETAMSSRTPRAMTKSPVVLAKEALVIGQHGLTAYGSHFSRKDFTQAQLFAILVLKQFFKTDYRGMVQMLQDFSDLRKVLNLKKVPHYTTLQKAEARLLKKGLSTTCSMLYSVPLAAAA